MKVLALYQAPVRATEPDESLGDAAERMRFFEVGALAVIEHGRLVGIITERDLVRAVADDIDPYRTPVSEYMTRGPVSVEPDDDLTTAVIRMVVAGARHLPVVEHGAVVGMVSARDLLAYDAAEASASGRSARRDARAGTAPDR